jgi:hypothetical protein
VLVRLSWKAFLDGFWRPIRATRRMSAVASTSRSASPAPQESQLKDRENGEIEKGKQDSEDQESGEEGGEEGEEEGKAEAEQSTQTNTSAEEGKSSEDDLVVTQLAPGVIAQGDWQAIWSAQHNNYYFHNAQTGETTWTNPLAPSDSSQNSNYAGTSQQHDPVAAAIAAGIDPELAYLDPSLALPTQTLEAGTFQAKFNARTGAFTKPDARDPTHLGEWERAQRMSSVYFDTAAYDEEVQRRKREEEEENARKRKKVTKKDLVRCLFE